MGSMVIFTTLFGIVIITILTIVTQFSPSPLPPFWWNALRIYIVCCFLAIAFFSFIRGYEVHPQEILVMRLGWAKSITLTGLKSIESNPEIMNNAMKYYSNPGLFSMLGVFRNLKYEKFRVWITDPKRSVVLKYDNEKTYVVSPGDPEKFIKLVKEYTAIN